MMPPAVGSPELACSRSALRKLARPPRYKGDGDALADEEPSAVSMVGGRTYFVGRGILGRPTRPTFVLWALTLVSGGERCEAPSL